MHCRALKWPILKFILVMFSLLTAVSCSSVDVAATRALEPDVSALQYELFVQYSELALHEMAEGNPDSAAQFNDKARQAAQGMAVKPDQPTDKIMQENYARLMELVSAKANSAPAAVVARAQVMYDCWLEERTQNVDKSQIVACQQAFEMAMHVYDTARSIKGH
jgi:hypothetical protein